MNAPATPIRLLLVEDQQLVREGLKGLLQLCPDIELIGSAAVAQSGVEDYKMLFHFSAPKRQRLLRLNMPTAAST